MIKVILFRDKDDEPKDEEIPVIIDFRPGTTTAQALETRRNVRQTGAKARHYKGLKQFYIGDFEVRANRADIN